jgi:hypothetical protein
MQVIPGDALAPSPPSGVQQVEAAKFSHGRITARHYVRRVILPLIG